MQNEFSDRISMKGSSPAKEIQKDDGLESGLEELVTETFYIPEDEEGSIPELPIEEEEWWIAGVPEENEDDSRFLSSGPPKKEWIQAFDRESWVWLDIWVLTGTVLFVKKESKGSFSVRTVFGNKVLSVWETLDEAKNWAWRETS